MRNKTGTNVELYNELIDLTHSHVHEDEVERKFYC